MKIQKVALPDSFYVKGLEIDSMELFLNSFWKDQQKNYWLSTIEKKSAWETKLHKISPKLHRNPPYSADSISVKLTSISSDRVKHFEDDLSGVAVEQVIPRRAATLAMKKTKTVQAKHVDVIEKQ